MQGFSLDPRLGEDGDHHRNLGMATVTSEIQRFAIKQEERLHQHVNVEAIQLLHVHGMKRRKNRHTNQFSVE
ncbi:hypothetical protein LSTR_LSTR002345 [Laodelphax striatellus]|uniref:Uncharacterized protein n=1 Tax=Laodelphax striatellus TaxID=195883 RepID=A0A482X2Q7_LAOST|nr:hypothetical protein LSTR_LSTR002345 [Laodelphax striatellus]